MLKPGRNIAIKVPLHRWDEMVAFYRDRAGLSVLNESDDFVSFDFGGMTLRLDRVPRQSRGDVFRELFWDDPSGDLDRLGGPTRDELEPLDGVAGPWTSDPAGTVLLVRHE